MLKACWECIAGELGNRQNNDESYSMKVNGDTQRAPPWPRTQFEKEKMFIIPKPLSPGDRIHISGSLTDYRRIFSLNLITGDMSPDYQNVAFQFEAIFPSEESEEDKCTIKIVQNGYTEIVGNNDDSDYKATDLFDDKNISFDLALDQSNNYAALDVFVGDTIITQVILKHNVNLIRFLSLSGDIEKVNKLCFEFA